MRSKISGFGIIEVVIAIALLGLAALGFSQFLMDASKGQKNVQNSVDFDILKTNVNLVLSSRSCDGAFQTAGGTPVMLTLPAGKTWATLTTTPVSNVLSPTAPLKIDQIKQGNTVIAKSGSSLGGMTLSKLEFVEATYEGEQSVTDTSTPPVTTTYKVFSVQLLIEATKQANSYGAPLLSTTLGTKIMVNPAGGTSDGRVEKCRITGVASDKGRSECPAGYSLVGTPGDLSAYCISTARRPAATVDAAMASCETETPSARLCEPAEWYWACRKKDTLDPPITQAMVGPSSKVEFLGVAPGNASSGSHYLADESCSAGASDCSTPPLQCYSHSLHNARIYNLSYQYRCCLR